MENRNLSVLRQVVEEGFGNANLHIIDQLISDNWVEHQLSLKGGKEVLHRAILSLDAAFSNKHYVLESHSVDGDIVWVHYRFNGVHTGPFMGHAATGKEVSIDVMDIARISNGQIVEHWGIPDRFSLLIQLGILQPAASGKQN